MKYQQLETRKVLIADDDEDNRFYLNSLLEFAGWKVSEAQNGKEAIEKVLTEQPTLVILDYWMPNLTGAEVYQYLQSQEIKVATILVSSDDELEKLSLNFGIECFLQKPFSISALLKKINSAYQHSFEQEELSK